MKIAVIGTGYVGLVTGTCFAETGNTVTCADIDSKKIEKLSSGLITIYEPGLEKLFLRNQKEGRLYFTTSLAQAIADAKINAERNNVSNAEFIVSDIKDYLKEFVINGNEGGINKVILDPPRSGLHPEICEILSETDLEKIVYISCNPSTQARDVKMICEKGKYIIEKIQPVDMFPHTYHVENVVSLIPA